MKSFEEIEKMVKETRALASAATDERILGGAADDGPEFSDDTPAAVDRTQLFRMLAVAAVLVLGLGLLSLLFPYNRDIIAEPLAWAEIQAAMADQNGVFITGTRRCVFPATETFAEQTYTYRTKKWASNAGYIDHTLEQDGTPVMQFAYHFESGTVTIVYNFAHQYYRFQVPEHYQQQLLDITPMGLIERLFQTEAEPLPPEWRSGRQTVGYAISDMDRRLDENLSPPWIRHFFFNLTRSDARLWIDIDTKLPVDMEGEFILDKCLFSDFETMHWEEVSDNWNWGTPVDQSAFFPTQPEGFQSMTVPPQN